MNDDDTRRQLARAAKDAQLVNSVQNVSAVIGFVLGAGLWLWLTFPSFGADQALAWWGIALIAGLVGAFALSRIALTLLSR